MRRFVWPLLAAGLLATQISVPSAQQAPKSHTLSTDEALKAYRSDLQSARADILAKNLTLSADQAAKFWPAYAKFQAEQSAILDPQIAAIQKYAETYTTLDDATARSLINANLARDSQMGELRTRWLGEFEKIVGVRIAARVIQIDRQLGLAHQLAVASEVPLVY